MARQSPGPAASSCCRADTRRRHLSLSVCTGSSLWRAETLLHGPVGCDAQSRGFWDSQAGREAPGLCGTCVAPVVPTCGRKEGPLVAQACHAGSHLPLVTALPASWLEGGGRLRLCHGVSRLVWGVRLVF